MDPLPDKKQIAERLFRFIEEHDNFLLSAHINADGDAIASVLATALLLEKLGKNHVMVFHDQEVDSRYSYLKNWNHILPFEKEPDLRTYLPKGVVESAIILDVPGYKRLGDVSRLLPDAAHCLKIDHHPVEDVFGPYDWVDEEASSTTAMVYEIIEVSGIDIDLELAKALYTGIVYDTGRLSFSNTRARDLAICARMVEIGVQPDQVTNDIFFENSFNALKTIGKGLYSLESHLDGLVNVVYLGYEDLSGNNQSEIEELANYSVAIKGGKVGLFIREVKPGFHKVSFRSKCHIDVNAVAKAFNGGGHSRAAGCRLEGTKDTILPQILSEIQKQL